MPVGVVVLLVIWAMIFFTSRYVSIASMGTAIAVPFVAIYGSYRHGYLADGTWNKPLFIFAIVIALLAVWRHRSNIKNLMNGTEHKFSRKKKRWDLHGKQDNPDCWIDASKPARNPHKKWFWISLFAKIQSQSGQKEEDRISDCPTRRQLRNWIKSVAMRMYNEQYC